MQIHIIVVVSKNIALGKLFFVTVEKLDVLKGLRSCMLKALHIVYVRFCARACGSGSQYRPNECIFGSGKPREVRILGRGVYESGEGNGEVSLRATWERGGRILS
jgi:hypothetical protein